jgi:histidinol dehydrogenase
MRDFNGVRVGPDRFRVTEEEIESSVRTVDREFRRAVADVLKRVRRFARAGLRPDWEIRAPRGGRLGERFLPLDRVGVYVPGGASPLASTALMTVPLAAVAGVREIVAATPCGRDGRVNPHILFALRAAGATEILRLGGIQAIAALAYGTETIRRVDKIVGPGGPFVTAAKRLVYGAVALDMVAGPSEVAVLADGTARAAGVASDLLSQAEHGTGHERTLLVTTSARLAEGVRRELVKQAARLPRRGPITEVLTRRTRLVIVPDLVSGVAVINRFAPEHLEILTREPRRELRGIRCAGAVFLGPWTPESAGDFVAGPSHVLPTGGTARYFAGLTVEDFRRRMSLLELTRRDLEEMMPSLEAFARVEQLPAHARSARARLA